MKDVIIVSGGNIQRDFALDFLQKNKKENVCLIAADKGVEFFIKTDWVPDVAVGDFDSLSEEGKLFLKQQEERRQNTDPKTSAAEDCEKHTETNLEIIRLKPEKDDSDTQSAMNLAIRRGTKNHDFWSDRQSNRPSACKFRTVGARQRAGHGYYIDRSVELHETG